jgi:hypothetical protein
VLDAVKRVILDEMATDSRLNRARYAFSRLRAEIEQLDINPYGCLTRDEVTYEIWRMEFAAVIKIAEELGVPVCFYEGEIKL